jgi:hypothetical protein
MAENLKTLAAFATPIEADIVRNRLEAAGVQAFLGDEQTVGWLWHLGTALQGVKVLVAEADLPRALALLQNLQVPQAEGGPPQAWSCPRCAAEVDGELEVCWACGTTADGVEDADFQDAEAAVTRKAAKEAGLKGPPGAILAVLIAFCIPMYIFNTLVGFDFFVSQARYPISGGLLFLVLAGDFLLVVGLFQWLYYQPPSLPAAAAATRPETASDAAPAEDEDWQRAIAAAMARRACLAALLGMVFCPLLLNFYSIWLILRYELYRPAVHRQSAFLVYTAIVIDAVVCLVSLMLFLLAGRFPGQ